MQKLTSFIFSLLLVAIFACSGPQKADLIVHNAKVYTVDSTFSTAEAFAVKDGKFVAVGSSKEILKAFSADNIIDNHGLPVYPGFIDAHCHFVGYAQNLIQADLTGTSSIKEIIQRLQEQEEKFPESDWLLGRGWDQNDWAVQEFPTKDTLDLLFPDKPVFLTRVDGHAAWVNSKALALAKIDAKTQLLGGKVILDKGQPSGVLIDNAVSIVEKVIPVMGREEAVSTILQAQENCFAVGLTTLSDAGLDKSAIDFLDSLQKNKSLKMRIYAMVNPTEENMNHYFANGHYKTDFMNVRSFKVYGDGALGSRGACLLKPYADDQTNTGFLLFEEAKYRDLAQKFFKNGFQMNTHCIGDSANRLILDIYKELLPENNNLRWRIEHAQVVSKDDVSKFRDRQVIPSIQPTHATSDMYWAGDRLGAERVKTAYAYQDLKIQQGLVALGSDFPVEHINPLYGFHSAVARKDDKNWPDGGFQMENALSREDALRGMTIWAAYSNFEEKEKGSIEVGKLADFVILEADIMSVEPEKIRETKVRNTFIGGEQVF